MYIVEKEIERAKVAALIDLQPIANEIKQKEQAYWNLADKEARAKTHKELEELHDHFRATCKAHNVSCDPLKIAD